MTYVVQEQTFGRYIKFDHAVNGMDLILTTEVRLTIDDATIFIEEQAAKDAIAEVEETGEFLPDRLIVINREVMEAEDKAKAEGERDRILKETWDNTSLQKRREMLTAMPEDKRTEWLEAVGDTTDIQPFTEDEQLEHEYNKFTKSTGLPLTLDEYKELKQRPTTE